MHSLFHETLSESPDDDCRHTVLSEPVMYARMSRMDGDPPPGLQGLGSPATRRFCRSRKGAPQEREQVLIGGQVTNERGVLERGRQREHAGIVAIGASV